MTILPALLLSVLCLAGSCGGDEPEAKPAPATEGTITVTPDQLTVSCDAQQVSVSVTADADWNVTTAADWISLFPSGGVKGSATTVKVSVTANTGMETRTGQLTVKSATAQRTLTVSQLPLQQLRLPLADCRISAEAQTLEIDVDSNTDWTAKTDAQWITVSTPSGSGKSVCQLKVTANDTDADRKGTVTFAYGAGETAVLTVSQFTDAIDVPEGYVLVWNDEFNDDKASLTDLWAYDVQGPGWVNNEKQRYVAGELNGVKTAEIHDGMLTITALKAGGEVISARLNSRQGWTYGIMEARVSLPKGKGTWPAFWMYPSRPNGSWPYCGEIDIMEEVGCVPNEVSSSIHCKAYNHVINTQKTAKRTLADAEGQFHVYRLEWTEDYIRTYVDGQQLFSFPNDKKGNRDTWPFDYDFKIILNLAWGGDWGGMWGVDESALPVKYDIDYVRVFQKK